MKTKDNLLKGIIIGIVVIIVPLILMGTTNTTSYNEVGTFQLVINNNSPSISNPQLYRINTKTGQLQQFDHYNSIWYDREKN